MDSHCHPVLVPGFPDVTKEAWGPPRPLWGRRRERMGQRRGAWRGRETASQAPRAAGSIVFGGLGMKF